MEALSCSAFMQCFHAVEVLPCSASSMEGVTHKSSSVWHAGTSISLRETPHVVKHAACSHKCHILVHTAAFERGGQQKKCHFVYVGQLSERFARSHKASSQCA